MEACTLIMRLVCTRAAEVGNIRDRDCRQTSSASVIGESANAVCAARHVYLHVCACAVSGPDYARRLRGKIIMREKSKMFKLTPAILVDVDKPTS